MDLTKEQQAFFHTFGYLALPVETFGDLVDELWAEGKHALETAFDEPGTVFVPVRHSSQMPKI